MNKKFKAIIAGVMATATVATMAFSASATNVTNSNDDGNFVYSSQYNDCRTGAAGGYVWNTAATQALYPEFTKSYLSTKPTYVSSKTHSSGMMVAMLDKSITTWEDAKNYVKNLTVKDKNGNVLLCKVERDSATGRFGLRALNIEQVEYKISKTVVNSRVEVKYTLKGLWVGANFNVFVSNVTYTGGGESYKANGRDGFDKADWYTYYTFKSNEALRNAKYYLGNGLSKETQKFTFDAILDKDGKQRNLTRVTHTNTVNNKSYVGLEAYSLNGKCTEKVATYDFGKNNNFVLFKKSGSTLYMYYGNGRDVDYDVKWQNDSKILSVIKYQSGYGLKRSGDLDGITEVKCYAGSQIKSYNGEYYLDEGLPVGSFKPSEV
ncbi:MAG: hypothetical protein E7490_03135 [Ruminococcaceae bacterium]|nr:hypothetical protein [Oscillospiraceae bacterium]